MVGRFFGAGKGKGDNQLTQRVNRADDVIITVTKKDQEIAYQGHGSWLSHLIIDDKEIWRLEDEVPKWKDMTEGLSDNTKILPSDSDLR